MIPNCDAPYKMESALYLWYIKYERLAQLMQYVKCSSDIVNLYVDLEQMLSRYYQPDTYCDETNAMTSIIINLVAHMRTYFKYRHRVNVRCYLIHGSELMHRQYLPKFGVNDYEMTTEYEKKHAFVEDKLKLLDMLCAYIPEVYYIRSGASFSAWTYYRIAQDLQNDPSSTHIALSTSKYCYQLPALLLGYNVYTMRARKSKDGDESLIVNPNQSLLIYYNHLSPSSPTRDVLCGLNPRLMSLLMAFNGCRDKKITAVTNINRAADMLYNAIKMNQIINDYQSDIGFVYKALERFNIHTVIDLPNLENRFKGLDIHYQSRLFAASPESKNMSWFKDLHDPETIKDLNLMYFKDSPIDLINL